jgi:hypothetical protein
MKEVPLIEQLARENAAREIAARRKANINVMPPGRRYYAAQFPADLSEWEKLLKRYYEALESLNYKEQMAWCRARGVKHSTYLMRRYKHRQPTPTEVYLTVAWFDAGKPVEQKNRYIIASFEDYMRNKDLLAKHSAQGRPGVLTAPDA